QHAPLDVQHVGPALPQVLVLDALEPRRHPAQVVTEHDAGVATPLADALVDGAPQLGILEHQQVRVVDLPLALPQLGGDALADLGEVAPRGPARPFEERDLLLDALGGDREVLDRELLAHDDVDRADPDARRRGDARELHAIPPKRVSTRFLSAAIASFSSGPSARRRRTLPDSAASPMSPRMLLPFTSTSS